MEMRDRQVNVRLAERERAMLAAIAESVGLRPAAALRLLVCERYAALRIADSPALAADRGIVLPSGGED